jgi:hypothetical protein
MDLRLKVKSIMRKVGVRDTPDGKVDVNIYSVKCVNDIGQEATFKQQDLHFEGLVIGQYGKITWESDQTTLSEFKEENPDDVLAEKKAGVKRKRK